MKTKVIMESRDIFICVQTCMQNWSDGLLSLHQDVLSCLLIITFQTFNVTSTLKRLFKSSVWRYWGEKTREKAGHLLKNVRHPTYFATDYSRYDHKNMGRCNEPNVTSARS